MKRAGRAAARFLPAPLRPPGDNGDGFPPYVAAARRAGMDVNDWEESELGWLPALPILTELVFPLLSTSSSVIELGVGTGRWARHLADRVPDGRLLLVDRSRWVVSFLTQYFASRQNVLAVRTDGTGIPSARDAWADLCFSQGVFIAMKLGHMLLYLREFARVLKPGGHAVFDFIDPETLGGWEFLELNSPVSYDVFAYHSLSSVIRACGAAGLEHEGTQVVGKSTYIITRKG